jgi:hypothetical protein
MLQLCTFQGNGCPVLLQLSKSWEAKLEYYLLLQLLLQHAKVAAAGGYSS